MTLSIKEMLDEIEREKSRREESRDVTTVNLLTSKQAARFLGISEVTLRRLRIKKIGPPWVKVSPKIIRYERGDLVRYVRQQTHGAQWSDLAKEGD